MDIIYMGTPDFAVPVLEQLLAAGHQIPLVVTQPDKPKGRGKAMQFPPVKECALAHGIPVFQPLKVKDPDCIESLRQYGADLIVVAAFGQILPKEILQMPKFGCINVHASLLPKYRGAAPIQWAVIDGEQKSGITIMQMGVGLDTGDMLSKAEMPLAADETGGSLHDKLAKAGARLCVETVAALEAGTIKAVPQGEEGASYAKMLQKQTGRIDWQQSAVKIERLIRGLNPWPSAYTYYQGKLIKIWRAEVDAQFAKKGQPGQILQADKEGLFVQTGDGALKLLEIQAEGKKRMDAAAYLRGYQMENGSFLKTER